MRLDPFAALAEYIAMQVGSQRMVERLLRNRALKQLLDGAPGWRELVALGKTWHLEQLREPSGAPRYDLIVMDAPATGHGLTFLDVPHVARSAVRSGPLARKSEQVDALVRDPARTLVLPVSLAEELPAQETAELVARLRDDLGLPVDRVVVNAIAPPAPGEDPAGLSRLLDSLPETIGLERLPGPPTLARCVAHLDARHRLNAHYVEEIERRTGLPILRLPLLARGVPDAAALRSLIAPLLATPDAPASPDARGAAAHPGTHA
jgi:hypothetical protein